MSNTNNIKNMKLYFLQPNSDQIRSIAKIIKEHDKGITTIALIINSEKYDKKLFDEFRIIKNYKDLPEDGLIIPGGAISTRWLLENRNIQLYNCCMSQNNLIVFDKEKFFNYCKKMGFPIPKTYSSINDIKNGDFPIFYKQKFEKGGGKRGVVHNEKELLTIKDDSLVYQEYIETKGTYGVGFIANNGELLCSYSHFEEFSYPKSGGSAVLIRPFFDERLIENTRNILKSIGYSGWGLAEYKFNEKTGEYVIMEINSKFWASCELAFRNEPQFFKYLFGIEKKKETINGLIYFDRALLSGVSQVLKILPYLFKYKVVINEISIKSILYSLFPEKVKIYFQIFKNR